MRVPQFGGRFFRDFVLFAVGFFFFVWNSEASGDARGYYVGAPPVNPGVIVFVHGLNGDGTQSWTNDKSKQYWPEAVRRDPAFAGYDVYVFEYPSRLFGRTYTIPQVSTIMDVVLSGHGVSTGHENFVFIAHSMGGLVVRQFLLNDPKALNKTKLAYFFATPTTGSWLARILGGISFNPQARDLIGLDDSTYLAKLNDDWRKEESVRHLTFCAYEVQDVDAVTVVSRSSAADSCSESKPVNESHISIVKPENRDSIPYLLFRNAFERTVAKIAAE